MGRRKIEIKAIKDDRNRSVTFLKRKGGLFKKAHELSVLCSVDVAVFIFGNNKKLYEYSSADMRDLITRYQYHGGPNEHKGPADYNGGDDDEDDDGEGTPPMHPRASMEPQMMPPQYHGQQPPSFPQIRHHTPSASPPIPNGSPYQGHPGQVPRGPSPQPHMGSRPGSRNDMRRMGPGMVQQPVQGSHPGITYMPTPPIYNPSQNQSNLMPPSAPPYGYHQPQPPYAEDRRSPAPPPGYTSQPPPPGIAVTSHPEQSPPPPRPQHLPPQQPHPMPHISPPPPRSELHPPLPMEPKTEGPDRPAQPPLLNTEIKKMPQRKGHSIFTPIEESRSILSQHLASFASEPTPMKPDASTAAAGAGRSTEGFASPPKPGTISNGVDKGRSVSISSASETTFTPPSRSDSMKQLSAGGSRARGPRLTVQIPDDASEPRSAAGDSNSPRTAADASAQVPRGPVLPPPSPSGASALLSAGATGPPNPFARPPPQQPVTVDTPASALPSRFLNNEFLPSPSSFYQDWNFRGSDNNTLPSPLNFATPVQSSGPSFLRDENPPATSSGNAPAATSTSLNVPGPGKRKTPDYEGPGEAAEEGAEAKRAKVS